MFICLDTSDVVVLLCTPVYSCVLGESIVSDVEDLRLKKEQTRSVLQFNGYLKWFFKEVDREGPMDHKPILTTPREL